MESYKVLNFQKRIDCGKNFILVQTNSKKKYNKNKTKNDKNTKLGEKCGEKL